MSGNPKAVGRETRGFLMRLLHDVRGNTLAIMTAALIPLAGLVGGGIDISRMYILKTRLQHACDAGALAGRKAMGGGTWSYNNNYAQTQANQFFDGNFASGAFSSTNLTRSFSEDAGVVSGTASATIPMTLMKIFKKTDETISVTCDAGMRIPNTDVMFVLDTTGSMSETPSGDTQTKLASLKESVKCFYEIVARLDTDANCTTGTPSGGTGSQTQVRFGFVPYSVNVNVGKLLPTSWFVDNAPYQTRKAMYETQRGQPVVSESDISASPVSNADCNDANIAAYNSTSASMSDNNSVKTVTTDTYKRKSWTPNTCTATRRRVVTTYDIAETGTTFSFWRYGQHSVNVGRLKSGTSWLNSFQWPVGANGANTTIAWDGCIEERQTVSQSSYNPIPSGAKDLDIDMVPTAGDPTTQWKPALQNLIWSRGDGSGWTLNTVDSEANMQRGRTYSCPREARKLQSWPDATLFGNYVDSLVAGGQTYHDIGLLWGGRLMSPTGVFASENANTPQGGEIERHMIFMTDGDPCAESENYGAYGFQWFDRRTVGVSTVPTSGCTNTGNLVAQTNARTEALCTAIKNKNITLWVITFGNVASATVTRMRNCASTGRYYSANNRAELQTTFKSIADQISQLRLTR